MSTLVARLCQLHRVDQELNGGRAASFPSNHLLTPYPHPIPPHLTPHPSSPPSTTTISSPPSHTLQYQNLSLLTLSGAGGGTPPSHTFVIPRKKSWEKLPIFFTFPKYENERFGTTFFSQITFSVVGRGPK